MNPTAKNDPDSIRSDIDHTRRQMDDTIDALGDRLQPRHLLDEFLGFLRGNSSDGNSRLTHMREKLSHSCNTAMHAVADTVKQNPMPALLIGAGVAWMIYESRRDRTADYDFEDYSRRGEDLDYGTETYYDRPLEYPPGTIAETGYTGTEEEKSKLGTMKDKIAEKASSATGAVKEKLSHAGEAARQRAGALRQRAGEMTSRMRESTHDAYVRTRERVTTTADQHPLEVGLIALAAGLIAGLAVPTPRAVNRRIGPTADRLRDRAREAGSELVEKGKRVAQAATSALQEEARNQGLTPERLREKVGNVAHRATEAGRQSAEREGLSPGATSSQPNPGQSSMYSQMPSGQSTPPSNPTTPPGGDPSVARPAI
jgi:ElaB/YqjD/DUF883 family membrane-anchored ribosome-binding protein